PGLAFKGDSGDAVCDLQPLGIGHGLFRQWPAVGAKHDLHAEIFDAARHAIRVPQGRAEIPETVVANAQEILTGSEESDGGELAELLVGRTQVEPSDEFEHTE